MKSDKIKVLEVLHGLAHGGIETFVISVAENIDKDQYQIDFALATDYPQLYEERVINNGNKVYKTKNLGSLKENWIHFVRLIRLCKKEKYDVLHTHIDFFNGVNLLAAWIAGVPVRICHSHNTRSANAESDKEPIKVKIYHLIMRTLINLFSTEKVGCSQAANEWMYKNTKGCKVILNAIDLSVYDKSKYDRERLIKHYEIDDHVTNIVTIGRIAEQKNPIFIANTIIELSKLTDSFHFHWISDGRMKQQVEECLNNAGCLDKVTFWGVRKDIPELLSCMDIFLFPSLWEGLGIVLIEAQSMGLPCFVSERIPEEANIGKCIVYKLSEGENVWASKIINALEQDSLESLQINTRKKDEYDIKRMIIHVEMLYSNMEE